MEELISEFVSETQESLDKLDENLLNLEQNPEDDRNLNEVFRLFHTIKGTSGFLNLDRLGMLAHAAENLISSYRDGSVAIESEGISLILKTVDRIKDLLNEISQLGKDPPGDDIDLIGALNQRLQQGVVKKAPAATRVAKSKKKAEEKKKQEKDQTPKEEILKGEALEDFIEKLFSEEIEEKQEGKQDGPTLVEDMAGELGRMILDPEEQTDIASHGQTPEHPSIDFPTDLPADMPADLPTDLPADISTDTGSVKEEETPSVNLEENFSALTNAQQGEDGKKQTWNNQGPELNQAPRDARVRIDLLENLMDAVSELVLTRNQILQLQKIATENKLDLPVQRLNQITSQLQDGIMKTRMQPVRQLWSRVPRIVRDISLELNKSIECTMYGEETEIDRQILELMRDPLLHLVRNACDHGIETPEERRRLGKPETGVINLRAQQEGGRIIIEIVDDGRGIDTQAVRRKFVQTGRLSEADAESISEHEIYNMLFEPGISTSERVSEISGRGVGLDVVRTNILKVNGTIDVRSTLSVGSTFLIKIPLSLAIVNALLVRCCDQVFALPQLSVMEVGRVTGDAMQIKYVNEFPVLQTRGVFFPVIQLEKLLNLKKDQNSPQGAEHWQDRHIIIVQGGSLSYGLAVDDIHDTEEIVVKPLSKVLSGLKYFSGNTILGDGRVIMILDPHNLASAIRGVSKLTQEQMNLLPNEATEANESRVGMNYLLFKERGFKQSLAINLLQVTRIEELDLSQVEYPSGRASLIYGGKLMPVVSVSEGELPKQGVHPALIFSFRGRNLGLLIEEIVDIVESDTIVDITDPGKKIAGSTIIDGQTIDILDVDYYIKKYLPKAGDTRQLTEERTHRPYRERIMIIEPNPARFAQYQQILLEASAKSDLQVRGSTALKAFNQSRSYQKVLCSENLSDMSPIEFVKDLRKTAYGRNVNAYVICDALSEEEDKYLDAGYSGCITQDDFSKSLEKLGLVQDS